MINKLSLHVDIFKHWLDNFELVVFEIEDEDQKDVKKLLEKIIKLEPIDNTEIEQLYALSLNNALSQKNNFIKFQAKKIVNFINSDVLKNITKEL